MVRTLPHQVAQQTDHRREGQCHRRLRDWCQDAEGDKEVNGCDKRPPGAVRSSLPTCSRCCAPFELTRAFDSFTLSCFILHHCRLAEVSCLFNEGSRFLRGFNNIKSLDKLPTMTGDEREMLMQWLPVALQSGDGILSEDNTRVSCICCNLRD